MAVSISVTGRRCAISSITGSFRSDRIAEIAGEDARAKYEELHGDRLVEAELGVDPLDIGVDGAVAEHGAGRIARQQPHEDEGDHQDEGDGRNGLQNASENEAQKRQDDRSRPCQIMRDARGRRLAGRRPCVSLLLKPCRAKDIVAERDLQEACTFLLERHRIGRLVERDGRAARVEDLLHPRVLLGALGRVDLLLRSLEQLVRLLALPAAVQRVDGRRIDEVRGDLVRIGDVVGPAPKRAS